MDNMHSQDNLVYKNILKSEKAARDGADLIQRYSWGLDYPVDAWSELKEAELIIGCFDGPVLVGLSSVTRVASPDGIDNGRLWYADAVVIPAYRRKGIFTKLYTQIMAYVKGTNESEVLTCTSNPIVEQFLIERGWVVLRDTIDESGEACRVLRYDIIQ